MSARRRFAPEQALCLVAAAVLLASVHWTLGRRGTIVGLQGPLPPTALGDGDHVRKTWPPAPVPAAWAHPGREGCEGAWSFDLFTPPTLFRHAPTGLLTAAPVMTAKPEELPAFGLELLGVQRELFRLQLVGYAGAPGEWRAILVAPQSAEVLVARAGARFEPLGLSLTSLELRQVEGAGSARPPAAGIAAVAKLRDERTGDEVVLHSHERRHTEVPLARLSLGDAPRPRLLREGDVLTAREATFRVERIRLDPPEVIVARHTAGSARPEIRVLTPTAAASPAAHASRAAQRAATTGHATAQP